MGRRAGAGHDLAFLDGGDAIAEQLLSVEDLLEVAAQLDLEAVAAKPRAHVELRAGRWRGLLGLVAAAVLGMYFVQTAYASGSPELVVAGLTVIDPLVGVSIGIIVLGEAASAPWWADVAFVLAGAIAVYGVIRLSLHQPRPAAVTGSSRADSRA